MVAARPLDVLSSTISAAPPAITTAASRHTAETPIGADQKARLALPRALIQTSAPTRVGAAPISAQPASDIHNPVW